MRGAGVEQGRRAGQVGQRGHQPVEADRFGRRVRQAAGHAQQPVLRQFDHVAAGRMAQQVAVVDGAQAEVLEPAVRAEVDGVVELARVRRDEGRGGVADQALAVAERDALAERVHALAAHLLADVAGEQAGGELGVRGLLGDEFGGGLDGQPVQFGGGGAVVEAADGLGGDPHRVDVRQVRRRSGRPRGRSCRRRPASYSPLRLRTRMVTAAVVSRGHSSLPVRFAEIRSTEGRQEGARDTAAAPGAAPVSRSSSRPPSGRGHPHARSRTGWQVFGLTDTVGAWRAPTSYWPSLPRPRRAQCCLTAVVPVHRCGAVPVSHRVPSCDDRSGGSVEPAVQHNTWVRSDDSPPTSSRRVACRAANARGGWSADSIVPRNRFRDGQTVDGRRADRVGCPWTGRYGVRALVAPSGHSPLLNPG